MKKFTTQANQFWVYTLPAIVICPALIAIAAVWGLSQEPKNTAVIIFASAIAVFVYGLLFLFSKGNYVITFTFEDNKLHIDGTTANSAHYVVEGIPASDFVLTQSEKDKKRDRCTLKIKNTIFKYKNVENYSALKAYIEENFD